MQKLPRFAAKACIGPFPDIGVAIGLLPPKVSLGPNAGRVTGLRLVPTALLRDTAVSPTACRGSCTQERYTGLRRACVQFSEFLIPCFIGEP